VIHDYKLDDMCEQPQKDALVEGFSAF